MASLASVVPTGYPVWSRSADIGDYGGATDKRDSETEGSVPYALYVYREMQNMRGSAYSKKTGTLVHVENLAIARTLAALNYRKPEQVRANAVPLTSDEKLEYWVEVQGLPFRLNEQRWQLRQRAAAHYKAAVGPTRSNIETAVSDLLGDAFVSLTVYEGTDLANPPDPTIWPTINPGDSSYSLGGGAWYSYRCYYVFDVAQPSGMTLSDFANLIDVQLFQLLDRILPSWATYAVASSDDGFLLDNDLLDVDLL